jgi:hypothetical protein
MSERREKLVEIAKALGFVLVGFFGGMAAAAFVDGFRDGWDNAARERGVEQPAGDTPGSDQPRKIRPDG